MTRTITRYNLSELRRIRASVQNSDSVLEIAPGNYVSSTPPELNNAEIVRAINELLRVIENVQKAERLNIELDFWED